MDPLTRSARTGAEPAATLKAANDLYGANSAEAKKVAEAWSAVGVN